MCSLAWEGMGSCWQTGAARCTQPLPESREENLHSGNGSTELCPRRAEPWGCGHGMGTAAPASPQGLGTRHGPGNSLILPALPITDRISAREARGALDQQLPGRGCACVPARAHPVHSACYSPFCGDAGPRAEGARLAEGRQRQKVLSIQSRPLGVTSSGTWGMDARSLLELPQAARISVARRELQPPLPLAASTPGQKEMASQGSSHIWHAAAAAALVPAVLRQGRVAALLPGGVPAWRGCAVAGKQLVSGAWPWLEERSGAEHP